jgi:plasmid stabilization system protein ParE
VSYRARHTKAARNELLRMFAFLLESDLLAAA